MEYVRGTKVTGLNPVALIDIDPEGLADELFQAYLKQILLDGFFHADPHPGNVFITEDGRIALMDLGMVATCRRRCRTLAELILAISEGAERRRQTRPSYSARSVKTLTKRRSSATWFRSSATTSAPRSRTFQVGRIVLEVNQSAGSHGIKSAGRAHHAGQDAADARQHRAHPGPGARRQCIHQAERIKADERRLLKSLSPGTVFTTVLEAKEFAEQLPRRINRVLESLASSQLKLKVEVIDEGAVIDGLQKVANRITMGLVVAALIISAAMMMRIESRFTLSGIRGSRLC